jgi:CBS domain-containing protein
MTTVRQLLLQKGDSVWSVNPSTSIGFALKIMRDKDIGALIVIERDVVVGVFSERDFAREVGCKGCADLDAPVETLMSKPVFYVSPESFIDDCMALMTEKHIRHLPVIEMSRLVGVVSIGDVVKAIISEKETSIRSLENYIQGREYNQ